MNVRYSLICSLTALTLLASGASMAQQDPAAPSVPTAPNAANAGSNAATYPTATGAVTVQSVNAPAPSFGPPPPFDTLAGGGKSITSDQADAYPPLANDFLNADSNKDGKISKSEYARWVKQF